MIEIDTHAATVALIMSLAITMLIALWIDNDFTDSDP